MTVDVHAIPERTEGMIGEPSGDMTLVFKEGNEIDIRSSFVLSESASLVFSLCDGKHSVSQILEELKSTYEAPEDLLNSDLLECIGRLIEEGLVRVP